MPHKIMLVEDDLPILEMMEILLRRIGYEPILVPDVLDALRQVKDDPPSLILLDIMMTPMTAGNFQRNSVGNLVCGISPCYCSPRRHQWRRRSPS